MSKKFVIAILALSFAVIALLITLTVHGNVAVLSPKGSIAQQQFDLIIFTSLLSLVIIVPVFALTFYIAWKYRASNTKATYSPDWDHSRVAEAIWWIIPLLLITILAVITWQTSHRLDPYKPISSDKKPITIQVVALQWKWLFIYPKQNIATINYIQFPEKTPINFELTSDAPMNSFWIPELGGQVYAMSGMKTKLHLEATQPGEYRGSSANISGEGFADMHFVAKATSPADFEAWIKEVKRKPEHLTEEVYEKLVKPSRNTPVTYFSGRDESLYDTVIMKYMMPQHNGMDRHNKLIHEGATYSH